MNEGYKVYSFLSFNKFILVYLFQWPHTWIFEINTLNFEKDYSLAEIPLDQTRKERLSLELWTIFSVFHLVHEQWLSDAFGIHSKPIPPLPPYDVASKQTYKNKIRNEREEKTTDKKKSGSCLFFIFVNGSCLKSLIYKTTNVPTYYYFIALTRSYEIVL